MTDQTNAQPHVTCLFCGVPIEERSLKSGMKWARINPPGNVARVLCEGSPNAWHRPSMGPEDGHTFRVSVESRGSYGVTGVEGCTDADYWDRLPGVVEVRAWNLTDALSRAAHYPLSSWFPPDTTDDDGPLVPE